MKADFSLISISKRYGRLVRVVAVFFLLFTAADLMMPQYFCGEGEIGGVPLRIVDAASTTSDKVADMQLAALPDTNDSRRDEPSREAPHEEDCFCCCAHVLPGLAFGAVSTSELKSAVAPFVTDSLPTPPLGATYHPPRIA